MRYPRLRQLRMEHFLTQRQIAELLGCTPNQYSKYERGKRNMPLRYWLALACYYHVSLDYMVGRTNQRERW